MTQRIYLSRHGQTEQNLLVKKGIHWWADLRYVKNDDIWALTDQGRDVEPRVLGDYLRAFVIDDSNRDDFIIVTSSLLRSSYTGIVVAERTGIPEDRIHWFSEFNEANQRELLPQDYESQPQFIRDVIDNSQTSADIGQKVDAHMRKVIADFPGKDIIATLHRNVCLNFLKHQGYELKSFGNCGLVTLEHDDGLFRIVGPYMTNDQMRSALEQRTSAYEMMEDITPTPTY